MLILSRDDMKRVLDVHELFDALKQGFEMLAAGQWKAPLRTVIEMPKHDGISLFMPAYCEGLGSAGMKLVTVMSGNPARNLPLIHSDYMYVSAETGQVLSLMDAEVLTGMRTAATSALVTDLIGKSGGRTMAIFGTGIQAWWHVSAFVKLFSMGEVLVFGLTPELAEPFAVRIERELRVPARRAVMPELKRAEIICTCTTNTEPLFEYKDLRTNAHIVAMGAYRPNTREIGSDVVSKATVIVDTYEGALNEAGEIVMPLNEGVIRRDHLYAAIHELVTGAKEAPDENNLTLFKSLGMALEDLVAADLAYKKAKEKGIGTEVKV